jgi:GDP-4-dehydro-6-deoxy-D-mannose reductase
MAKIIVTGASGFIGRHLVPFLTAAGHQATAVGSALGDLADEATWKKLPPGEVVIHLAGKSFVPDSWGAPTPFFRTNVLSTIAGLEYCRANQARFIFLSSYMYGNQQKLPIPETAGLEVLNPYALSKKFAEEACRFYADNFGLSVTVLRLFNLYGGGQPEHFLIPTIIAQVRKRVPIVVKDLEPKRDYIYIDDVIDVLDRVLRSAGPGLNIFNVGSGRSYSVKELIDIIQQIEQTNLPITVDGVRRKGEIMDTIADISQARTVLGWQPQWPLERGLRALLEKR